MGAKLGRPPGKARCDHDWRETFGYIGEGRGRRWGSWFRCGRCGKEITRSEHDTRSPYAGSGPRARSAENSGTYAGKVGRFFPKGSARGTRENGGSTGSE